MRFDALDIDGPGFRRVIDELRFRFHKWDAYLAGSLRVLPEALVLGADEHAAAVETCLALDAALGRVAARAKATPECWERLAIPVPVRELVAAETERPFQLARYDLVPTAEGWMLPEFNEDAPGGFNEAVAAPALFAPLLVRGELAGDFAASFLAGMPPGRSVGLVYATGYAEDLQHVLILADLLRTRGLETVLASPEQLSCGAFGRPRLAGRSVDWILRFFPAEWYGALANRRAWRRALARIPVVNPLGRILRQSKGLFAWWRAAPGIEPVDRALLARHTPHTEFLEHRTLPRLAQERERWVLKRMFGRMGDAVVIGRRTPAADWERCLAEIGRRPEEWIAQHAFQPLAFPSTTGAPLYPVLGVYLIDGRFAGHYSRADEIGFTTHEAYHVVTAVEAPGGPRPDPAPLAPLVSAALGR